MLYQRLVQARAAQSGDEGGGDRPRRTATCEIADLHLALAPGSDAGLFVGLLNVIEPGQGSDWSVSGSRRFSGCPLTTSPRFTPGLSAAPRAVTLTMGINQSTSGSDKCNAVINVHLASGKIGRPGCGPLFLTGQPNAMGGREVGGLAQSTGGAHALYPGRSEPGGAFLGTERLAQTSGLMAVELFEAIARGGERGMDHGH